MRIDAGRAPTPAPQPELTFSYTRAPNAAVDTFAGPNAAASVAPQVVDDDLTQEAAGLFDGWVMMAEKCVGQLRSWVVGWADQITRQVVDVHNEIVSLADLMSGRAMFLLERLRRFVGAFASRKI